VFTAIKSVLIQPLPYAHPWELVQVGTDFENVRQSELLPVITKRSFLELGRL
jgi:hypothetical protein